MLLLSLKLCGAFKELMVVVLFGWHRFKYFLSQTCPGCNANMKSGRNMVIGGHGITTMIPLTLVLLLKVALPVSNLLV